MNEKLYSLLAELGEQLKESDEVKEYAAAREEYSADRGISEKVAEYNVQRMVYDQESSKDEKDTLLIEQIKARMDALYDEITSNPVMKRYIAAEDGVNRLFGEINHVLQGYVVPESEQGCGGDCGSCAGCH